MSESESEDIVLVSIYLYILFGYVFLGALISGVLIYVAYKQCRKIEVKMIKKVDYFTRLVCSVELLNLFLFMPYASSFALMEDLSTIWVYLKMLVEFVAALISFFVREHHFFRWVSLGLQCFVLIVNILFMRELMSEIYCKENGICELEFTLTELYLLYVQFTAGFILEIVVMVLVSNIMMSLGWFYTKRFPPQLNLEQYGIERPKEKDKIEDMIYHSVYVK